MSALDGAGWAPHWGSSSCPFVRVIVYRSQENKSCLLNEFYVLASNLVTGHLYLSFVEPLLGMPPISYHIWNLYLKSAPTGFVQDGPQCRDFHPFCQPSGPSYVFKRG